ncbi:MAG: purine-nucleoside phosphorylase, partial [Clostridia bacterium]|nr:purine-nucleoside phosphorylase [Clostridia bacterium]
YLEGVPVILMDGRVHYYEGYTMEEVVTPVRIMAKMGVKTVILTNASGSMREELAPGDLVCINDHISSFIPNPLIGQNDDELGERFVDMSEAYDPHLRSIAHEAARELGMELKDGVYMQVTGPTYETPAEARAYASLGADIVGMSTVCETIVLRHMDVDVLGISCVTNYCPNVVREGTSHEEVQEMADKAGGGMVKLVRLAVKKIGEERAAE